MAKKVEHLIEELKPKIEEWERKIVSLREMVLSNLVMISQVPAQTFAEKERAIFLLDRYIESGIPEPLTDEMDNVIGVIYGERSTRTILVFAHMDHQFEPSMENNVIITEQKAKGPGVADDIMGLAVLISLPDILNRLGVKFNSDIILLASTRSHGRGDFGGIRHFIENNRGKIDFAINLVGVTLGRIDYFTLSRVRCDIKCEINTPQYSAWGKFGHTSAIMIINEIMSQLFSIPLPRNPKTVLNIGMVSGGESYSTVSSEATVNLEVLSEDDKVTESLVEEIRDRCIDIGAKHGIDLHIEFFGRHHAAGLSCSHPLVKSAITIIKHLGYQPIMEYSHSEITVPLSRKIPSLNLGITTGKRSNTPKGYVDLAPIPKGILQLIMLLYAIDRGYCDERAK